MSMDDVEFGWLPDDWELTIWVHSLGDARRFEVTLENPAAKHRWRAVSLAGALGAARDWLELHGELGG